MSEQIINKYVDLVSSTRGDVVENIHQGIAVAMDSEGRIIKQWGDITTEIFPRSALKLIQLIILLIVLFIIIWNFPRGRF